MVFDSVVKEIEPLFRDTSSFVPDEKYVEWINSRETYTVIKSFLNYLIEKPHMCFSMSETKTCFMSKQCKDCDWPEQFKPHERR